MTIKLRNGIFLAPFHPVDEDPTLCIQRDFELIEHLEYARTELQNNGGKAPQAKRVVMETQEDKQAMGWVVMGLLGVLVALGITAFIFRDRIFSSGEEKTATSDERLSRLIGDFTRRIRTAGSIGRMGEHRTGNCQRVVARRVLSRR